jgi:glycosyltransferase involved in cell wall biosynthesis
MHGLATLATLAADGKQSTGPALSVITPCFNPGPFLEETLDSVADLRASHEHIVVDGASTDGSVQALQARDDPSLVWVSEPDRGQTHAVNKGLERARGELIGWLNADDAYVPEHLDEAVRLLLDHPNLDAIFGDMDIIDAAGNLIRRHRTSRFSWRRYLYFGYYLPTPTIVFRRAMLRHAPRLDERYSDAADYDFYLRLMRGARVRRIDRPLVRFRYHAGSKTARNAGTQRREGLEIRLGYARHLGERWLMRGLHGAKAVRDAVRSPWPELQRR